MKNRKPRVKGYQSVKGKLLENPEPREKYFSLFAAIVLLAFGLYHSILYFGHQAVPHFDFNCFSNLGHQLLSLQVPSSFKRVPLVGILQVLIGKVVGGRYPDFTGGWVLNCILHPLNVLLFWLVGRKIVGKGALWVAVILAINPWVVQLLTEAIAETTLLFFILASFYLIFKRSKFSYVVASMSTMVRYEGVALILVAFVMDIMQSRSGRERLRVVGYAALASIPFGLWMLGTIMHWHSEGGTHYLKEMGQYSGGKIILAQYIKLIWQVGFYPLITLEPASGKEAFKMLFGFSKVAAGGFFGFGVVYGLYKRDWKILALLMFFVPYVLVHAVHGVSFYRFCMPVSWIAVLICFYGLCSAWRLIDKGQRIPRAIVTTGLVMVLLAVACWLWVLLPYLPKMTAISRRSASLPYVSIFVILILLWGRSFFCRVRYFWPNILILVIATLIIVSNQFILVPVVGNGERDIEFKHLVDWYINNAAKGKKLATTVPVILQTMAPEYKDCFVHTRDIEGDNPEEFIQGCYQQNITYVAWDSRMGFHPNDRYYCFWKMKNIVPLGDGCSVGPYEFIRRVGGNRRFVNIYRLHRPRGKPESDADANL